MQDLVYILITAAFFAGCVGYVRALDRLVGPPDGVDEPGAASATATAPTELAEVRR